MTVSIHKLTAGDGYTYLTRQVAAGDATHRGRAELGDYYSQKGESPGRWMGRGLAAFASAPKGWADLDKQGLWQVRPDTAVTEAQMLALFGLGLHPNANAISEKAATELKRAGADHLVKLGRPFVINQASTELHRRLAVAYRDHNLANSLKWNEPVEETLRNQFKTKIARDMFAEQYGREPADARELTGFIARQSRDETTSVAGYDYTFSPVKSFSVLWALAPKELAQTLEKCHDQAVADTVAWLEDNAAFTRTGTDGVAQVDTQGLIAAAFTHRDSRAGDPDLHTHVAVSNKVRGKDATGMWHWLALDGRATFKSGVAASEFYNSRLEAYAVQDAGLNFSERPGGQRGKRAVREVDGIPTQLCEMFSSRRTAIAARYTDLAKAFQANYGREPDLREAIAMHQQATLETRTAKHEPRSLAEQRAQWRTQAVEFFADGGDIATMLTDVYQPRTPGDAHTVDVDSLAHAVVATVAQSRSVWQRTHIYAEAHRQVRAAGLATDTETLDRITTEVTKTALSAPLSHAHARVTDAELGEPEALRRRDGASVYSIHGAQLFTSAQMLAAEQRIITAAGQRDGRAATDTHVALALLEHHANRGTALNTGQETLVRELACSGARVQLALAPAGAGKTTAMAALARAWEESGGHVLGLSPGANQAKLLRDDINSDCDTIDKFIWLHNNPDAADPARVWFDAIDDKTLIIVDEAGKAGTLQLDAVISVALARGASVRLVGDDQQLAAISAGGVLRDIERTHDAVRLTEVMRFKSRAEAHAGLALRDGDPTGLAFYADTGRIHVGSGDTILDAAYQAWADDQARGVDTAMLAPTNDMVTALNQRARLDRLRADPDSIGDGRTTTLADQLTVSAGDIVVTRRNNRRLRLGGGRDFVRNGYRWQVVAVHADGALTVTKLDTGHKTVLPADYVARDTMLGYAATIDASQGMTIGSRTQEGTCHVVGTESLSRQQLYTALTRGTDANHIYLSTGETDAHNALTPKAIHPDTAMEVLQRVVARDGAQTSATTAAHTAADPALRLGGAAAMYQHSLGAMAEHHAGPTVLAAITTEAERLHPGLTDTGGWAVLRAQLAVLAAAGRDPITALNTATATGGLTNAADPAAVLSWRLHPGAAHRKENGPLPWLPGIPPALAEHTDWLTYVQARGALVLNLANQVRDTARTWDTTTAPRWAQPLLAAKAPADLVADIAVFRAAHNVDDTDTRLTGPTQHAVRDSATQQGLDHAITGLLGKPDNTLARYTTLVDQLDPRIATDPYWPHLATHLATVARSGANVRTLLTDSVTEQPLPDEMPAAALWWRLAGRLQPAALEGDRHLRPPWLSDLVAVFGTATAETIAADPAFAGLVAAIGHADPARWTPRELLHLASEHLRDADDPAHPVTVDQYARLLTYTIELFTAEHPFDHDIPLPDDEPPTEEEAAAAEAAADWWQPPSARRQPPSDAALLDLLGLGYGGALLPPADPETLPFDYYESADPAFTGLDFDDLSSTPPDRRARRSTPVDIDALRTQYDTAVSDYDTLRHQVTAGNGPAAQAFAADLPGLRARADADRPHLAAVQDVMSRWADAEEAEQAAHHLIGHHQNRLNILLNQPDADPLDIAAAQADIDLAKLTLPATTPAERFRDELTTAMAARAAATAPGEAIITAADIDAAHIDAAAADITALTAARNRVMQLANDLASAQTSVALAFAKTQVRNAERIAGRSDALQTELAVLRAADDNRRQRGFTPSAAALAGLDTTTSAAVTRLARQSSAVTAVTVFDPTDTLAAMRALHTAAAANNHHILWCTTGENSITATAGAPTIADEHTPIDQLRQHIRDGHTNHSTADSIIVEDAASADPGALADLAQHAATSGARLILLHNRGTQNPQPAAALLSLLHHDLPWSQTLTAAGPIAREIHNPDNDPLLIQAERLDSTELPDDVAAAVTERHRLRTKYRTRATGQHIRWRDTATTQTTHHRSSDVADLDL
ncbi:relaxase domain-containing protein [Mycobacterium sp. M1]|uniref:Relaxase domain-containing protein n=1 Tax=Mycolicibacter acidiphilus TaxID=2835306 RepID=A0ABS5RRJ0_9MYCO|nr:MobF family relaxase [Mycolicibacter acidiphilus]MBS9535579.1 relaxase domain-containing protein [Mycolicibacter acidiphilus]